MPAEGRPRSFGKAALLLASGTAAGQGAAVLVSPVVSRLFDAHAFATLGSFAALLSLAAPAACLRYDAAVPAAETEEQADDLAGVCLVAAAATGLLMAALGWAFGGQVAERLANPGLGPLLPWVGLGVAGQGLYLGLNSLALRRRAYASSARTKLAQGVSLALAQLAAGVLKLGAPGLVAADLLGRVAGSGTLFRALDGTALLRGRKAAGMRAGARRFASTAAYGTPAALLHNALATVPVLLSGAYGTAQFGAYALGTRFVWGPVSLAGQSLAQVYTGEAGRWSREDPARLERSFRKLVGRLALAGLALFGALAAFGPVVVPFVFGPQWAQAGELARAQSPGWFAMFVVGPVLPTLSLLERQRAQLLLDAAGLAGMAGVLAYGPRAGWPMVQTVAAMSLVLVATYSALGLACYAAVRSASRPR